MKVASKLKEVREIINTWEIYFTHTYANGEHIGHEPYGQFMDDVDKIKRLTYEINSELKENKNQLTFINFSKNKELESD